MRTGIWQIERLARDRVAGRLAVRSALAPAAILSECEVDELDKEAARSLLLELAGIVNVEPGHFRADDLLGKLLRVTREELDPAPTADAWRRAGLTDQIEVFGYDIMSMVERLSTKAAWRRKWQELSPRPRSEEDWLNRIMSMTLGEFLRFFAATARP